MERKSMHAHIHTYTYQYVLDTTAVAAAVAAELLTQVIDLHCKSIHFKIKKSKLLRSVADEKACMHTYIHTSTNTY